MENLQQKCKDPVVLKAVVDQKNSDEIKMVFLRCFQMGATTLSAQELYKAPSRIATCLK